METPISYRALLGQHDVRRITCAMLLSRTAVMGWSVALVLTVLLDFHSAPLAGLCAFASMIPGLMVSPVMGALLDRYQRIHLVILDYAVAASTLALLAFLSAIGKLSPVTLVVLVGLNSLTNSLSSSGVRAAFPLILPRAMWNRANALDATTQQIATIAGPLIAGFLVATLHTQGTFVAMALMWTAAALVLVGVKVVTPQRDEQHHVLIEARQGFGYLLRNPTLRGIALSSSLASIPIGALTVCLPLLVLSRFHGGASEVGALWGCAGVASALSVIVLGRRHIEGQERNLYIAGTLMLGMGIAIVAVSSISVLVIAGMVIYGLAGGPVYLSAWGMRQRRTDRAWFGRVIAISMALNISGFPIGSGLAGLLVQWSVQGTLVVSVALTILAAFLALRMIPQHADAPTD